MHHSAGRVNTRCLRPCAGPGMPGRPAAAVTWDVIGCPGLMQRLCTWCRCAACIIVAHADLAMHPGAPGCTGCITGEPGERRAAGAAVARDTPGLRLIDHATGMTKWQKYTPVPATASQPAGQRTEPSCACSHWLGSVPPNRALSTRITYP